MTLKFKSDNAVEELKKLENGQAEHQNNPEDETLEIGVEMFPLKSTSPPFIKESTEVIQVGNNTVRRSVRQRNKRAASPSGDDGLEMRKKSKPSYYVDPTDLDFDEIDKYELSYEELVEEARKRREAAAERARLRELGIEPEGIGEDRCFSPDFE